MLKPLCGAQQTFGKFFFFFFNFILFNITILYWFCHISKWICHRYTCVPHPEPSSLLPPHTIPLSHPSAPAPSIQYCASNLDWRLVSYMILYIFQCHSPKSSHPLPLPHSPKDCSIHQCLFCCLVYRVIVKEMGIPDHLTCNPRNLNAGQESTVRTRYGTTDWFQIGKGVWPGCILSSCLFICRVHHTKCWAGWKQAGIKIAGRNINNLRYTDDTTFKAESEEEPKSLLKVKEESKKAGFGI